MIPTMIPIVVGNGFIIDLESVLGKGWWLGSIRAVDAEGSICGKVDSTEFIG